MVYNLNMKSSFIVANFKAYSTTEEAEEWIKTFLERYQPDDNKTVILCPSFIHITLFQRHIRENGKPLLLGTQDVSMFDKGAYTGEVVAEALKNFVDIVIVGHSERRRYFHESHKNISAKITQAHRHDLKVILCTEKPEEYSETVFAVAYEPTSAIGTGNPEPPEKSLKALEAIRNQTRALHYLYGGSVDQSNVHEFLTAGFDGVLVGSSATDPIHFAHTIENA
jgi:triosephosphate isomerase (TIM)